MRDVLLNSELTEYAFVLNAERLPILETEKAISMLSKHHIEVSTIIVNKVIPHYADGSFMENRRKNEKPYVKQIFDTFARQEIIQVPLFEHDISSLEHLDGYAEKLYFYENIPSS